MWCSPCFHRQTSFAIPDNPFPVWLLWSKQEQGKWPPPVPLFSVKMKHWPRISTCWGCLLVAAMSLLIPSKHRGFWSVPKQDQDTCLSSRHQLSLLWWLDHQVEESGATSRQAGWGSEAVLAMYLPSYLSAQQHSFTSLTAHSWHFVFFCFLPSAYVSTAVYS